MRPRTRRACASRRVSLSGQRQVSREEIFAAAGVTENSSLLFLDVARCARQARSDPVDRRSDRAQALSRPPADHRHGARGVRAVAAAGQGAGHRRRRHGARRQRSSRGLPRCRSWSGRAPRCARAISSRCSIAIPAIRDQVRASILVAERRWNLRLKNGIDVRLPETRHRARARDARAARPREEPAQSRHRRGRPAARRPDHRPPLRRGRAGARGRAEEEHQEEGRRRVSDLAHGLAPKMKPISRAALGDRVRARHRHQQDRLRDRAAEAAPAAGRAAAPHPCDRGARHRPYPGAGHEIRQRGRYRGRRGNAAPRGRSPPSARAGVHVEFRRAVRSPPGARSANCSPRPCT